MAAETNNVSRISPRPELITPDPEATGADQKTVLVVEDNDLNRKLFHDLLEIRGYGIIETAEGMEALELAERHRPDLIIMDIQLAEVSGIEVIKWLKENDELKSIPIMAVTAFAMKGDDKRILAAGCEAYIAKPITVKTFLEAVARLLGETATPSAQR